MNTISNANRNLRAIVIPFRDDYDGIQKEIGIHHIVGWIVSHNMDPVPIIPGHKSSTLHQVIDITSQEGQDTIYNLCVEYNLKCTPLMRLSRKPGKDNFRGGNRFTDIAKEVSGFKSRSGNFSENDNG